MEGLSRMVQIGVEREGKHRRRIARLKKAGR